MSPSSSPNPLEAQRYGFKFFAAQPFEPGPRAAIPIFHEWIQSHRLDEEPLIDVVDYSHVHDGPGVLLVGHEAQYSLELADGELGLRYTRRGKGEGDVQARLTAAFRAALRACRLLQDEPALAGNLRFRFDEVEFHIHDRLVAPRSQDAFDVVKKELDRFLSGLYPGTERIDIEPTGGSKDPFALRLRFSPASVVPEVDVLLSRGN